MAGTPDEAVFAPLGSQACDEAFDASRCVRLSNVGWLTLTRYESSTFLGCPQPEPCA